MNNVQLFENTLRDSLYVYDDHPSVEQIAEFCSRMKDVGFTHIEAGHPLGLGAYEDSPIGFSDQELFDAVENDVIQNNLYMFFIPGIGEIEDVDIARKQGLFGLRVGINASEIANYYETLESLSDNDFHLCLNIMKSYSVTPSELIEAVEPIIGVLDVLYVVDSAGTMLPGETETYISKLKQNFPSMTLGFHGHNNLQLAMQNGLQAMESGAEFIDTTLSGIGRSAGNIATEIFIAVLNRKIGEYSEKFFLEVLELAGKYRKLLNSKAHSWDLQKYDALFGFSGFHSSNEHQVNEYLDGDNEASPEELILELCKLDQTNVNRDLLEEARKRLTKGREKNH